MIIRFEIDTSSGRFLIVHTYDTFRANKEQSYNLYFMGTVVRTQFNSNRVQ